MGCLSTEPTLSLCLRIINPPLPHLSDGLAGGSLNWVPMATARLAARATLFPDAVWKWQGSQKATSEHRLSARAFFLSDRLSVNYHRKHPQILSCILVIVLTKLHCLLWIGSVIIRQFFFKSFKKVHRFNVFSHLFSLSVKCSACCSSSVSLSLFYSCPCPRFVNS